jgi:DNA-binding CsgD family transcriptional regulator/PAS domain-containing protein
MALVDPSADNLERAIAGLYDAALRPELWTDWLASTTRLMGGHTSLAMAQNIRSGTIDLLSTHNFSPEAMALYGQYFHQHDLWTKRSAARPMQATLSADLCTDEEFAQSEIYNDFSRPHVGSMFYVVGSVFPTGDQLGVVGFQNPRNVGPFGRRHAKALQQLLPHLRRAIVMRTRIKDLETERTAALSALDSVMHGIVLVTRDAHLVHANRAAMTILEARDGISLGPKGILFAAKPAETAALRRLIDGCARPASGGGVVRLSRPSGARSIEALVTPLGPLGRGEISGRALAMVFLRDPESKPKLAPAVLRDLYRLTPGEARLAADLLSGSSLQEIAEARRLSRETLRSQLQDLFRKTGTNRQAALINFLATGLAFALHRPEPG